MKAKSKDRNQKGNESREGAVLFLGATDPVPLHADLLQG